MYISFCSVFYICTDILFVCMVFYYFGESLKWLVIVGDNNLLTGGVCDMCYMHNI